VRMIRLSADNDNETIDNSHNATLKKCPFCNTPLLTAELDIEHLENIFMLASIEISNHVIKTETYTCTTCDKSIQLSWEQFQ
jgi:hypothetical protein